MTHDRYRLLEQVSAAHSVQCFARAAPVLPVAGTLLQGVLRNPMASPNIIGVTNGAALMAVILMTVLPSHILLLPVLSVLLDWWRRILQD